MADFATLEQSSYDGKPIELVKFIIGGVTVHAYTSAEKAFTFESVEYVPVAGLTVDNITQDAEEQAPDVQINLPYTKEIPQFYLQGLSPLEVYVEIFAGHRDALDTQSLFSGYVVGCDFSGNFARVTCASEMALLKTLGLARTFSLRCQNQFSDPDTCTVDRELYKTTGAIAGIREGSIIEMGIVGEFENDYFSNGTAKRVSGDWRTIMKHTATDLYLIAPFSAMSVGETLTIYAGCDHLITTCAAKYDNAVNCQCWPAIPLKNPTQVKVDRFYAFTTFCNPVNQFGRKLGRFIAGTTAKAYSAEGSGACRFRSADSDQR